MNRDMLDAQAVYNIEEQLKNTRDIVAANKSLRKELADLKKKYNELSDQYDDLWEDYEFITSYYEDMSEEYY